MPTSFVLTYWLVGLALVVALTSIPLAARGAPRSYWWGQLAISLALALTLAGILYVGVYDRVSAVFGAIVGLGLIAAICAVATSGLIPDVVTAELRRTLIKSRLLHAIGAMTLLVVNVACAAAQSGRISQSPSWPSPPPLRGASATVSASRLRIAFPRIPLDSLGCGGLDTPPGGAPSRRYYFLVSNGFASSRYPDNHFMITGVNAYVAPSAKITRARLDSVLHVSELTVDEAAGEPPMYVRRTTPTFAVARYEGRRVVMEIAGEAAVRAFLAAGVDSVSLGWCERGELLSAVSVPLRRVPD